SSGAMYVVDRGSNSPNRKFSIGDFDLARLRGCPGKPGAGNPHAGFYLGGEAQGQPRLLPTDRSISGGAYSGQCQYEGVGKYTETAFYLCFRQLPVCSQYLL